MNILEQLKQLHTVPIPASTENPSMYWFKNNGTVTESDYAIVVNISDPVTGAPLGGLAYVMYSGFHSPDSVRGMAETYSRHRHVVTVNEAMAEDSMKRYGQIVWELCLTPVKVLDKLQEGYSSNGGF